MPTKSFQQNFLLPLLLFVSPALPLFTGQIQAQTSADPVAEDSADLQIEARLDELLAKMTLEEKVGQTALRGFSSRSKESADVLLEDIAAGKIGALLNVMNRDVVDRLQEAAVTESPHGIPILFARDVIHGFRTIFPIPLAQAASWNPDLVETGARIAAQEASTFGIRWTFAPMLDIARDARWGRIAESPGEDPYLAEQIAVAAVRGFQGDDLRGGDSLAACAKHFAAYGAAEGGRDYNTVDLSISRLHNVYLRPFRAAVDADALTFMTAFNEVNGVPATGSPYLLRKVLRDAWDFDGFVVSDWNSVIEMVAHGYAADERGAAHHGIVAGNDMEMTSRAYEDHLVALVREGVVPEELVDETARNILRVKMRLGLFDHPQRDASRDDTLLAPEFLEAARDAARQSTVLLKNEAAETGGAKILPLSKDGIRVAVVGPLADAPHEQLGTWTFDGKKENTVTPLRALRDELGDDRVLFAAGMTHSRDRSRDGFDDALQAAQEADVVLFLGGEEAILSGEAHSRADLRMPGAQEDLLREIAATGKPVVLILMAGRPLTLEDVHEHAAAILMAWHPGTMGGPALVDLLFGDHSPRGRLPVTWPKTAGQSPIYYGHKNTGRPAPGPDEEQPLAFDDIPVGAWQSSLSNTSRYLDAGTHPHFPFGFGLTYSDFEYSELSVGPERVAMDGVVVIEATLANRGERTATEVVQLYTRDEVASLTRPVRELQGFEAVTLEAGESRRVRFELPADALSFFGNDGASRLEAGAFRVWVAAHAQDARLEGGFELIDAAASEDAAEDAP